MRTNSPKERIMKRMLSTLLILAMVVTYMPLMSWTMSGGVYADGEISGNCGYAASDDVKWTVSKSTGSGNYDTLTISGHWRMAGWNVATAVPWHDYQSTITTAIVKGSTYLYNIGMGSFRSCANLTRVTLPGTLETIDEGAFLGCTSLQSITIPSKVTNIKDNAFKDCSSLTNIEFKSSSVPTFGTDAFKDLPSSGTVNVPSGTAASYKTALENAGISFSESGWIISEPVCKIDSTEYNSIADALASATSGNTIKLTDDIKENVTIASDTTITLDLNGHVLQATATDTSVITNQGTLTITDSDSSAEHKFATATGGKWWKLDDSGSITVTGGCITGGNTSMGGGINNEGTLLIEKANIVGNKAESFGGGIYNHGALTIKSVNIEGNYAANKGGGIQQHEGSLTLDGGEVTIKNNVSGVDATTGNLHLASGTTITIASGANLTGSKIGISTEGTPSDASPVNITGANSENHKQYFSSDEGYSVINNGSGTNYIVALASKHTHVWGYQASGSDLYAFCIATAGSGGCDYKGSATDLTNAVKITVESPIKDKYSSEPIEATLNNIENWTYAELAVPTIIYYTDASLTNLTSTATNGASANGAAPANEGTYYAAISASGTNTPKASVKFEVTAHTHCVCGKNDCSGTGHDKDQKWKRWPSATSLPIEAGYWYLDEDVTIDSAWHPASGTNLCLNGHVIKMTGNGQAIYVESNKELTITDCNSENNTHYFTVDGNGVWNLTTDARKASATSIASITDSLSTGNIIAVTGGCITGGKASGVDNSGTLSIYAGNIVGNTSSESGGGIENKSDATTTVYDGNIAGNRGSYGGGIFNSGTLSIHAGNITGNRGKNGAGGIDNQGTLEITGGSIQYNTAENIGDGGGIVNGDSAQLATISNAVIAYNYTNKNGAGIHNKATMVLNNTIVKNNIVKGGGQGGGIYNGKSLTITGGSISENEIVYTTVSDGGGGVFNASNCTATLTNVEIKDNKVSGTQYGNGGGIYNQVGNLTLSGVTITGNEAKENGGGLYFGNTSSDKGGSIVFASGKIYIQGNSTEKASTSNLHLVEGKTVTISSPTSLAGDSKIGVTTDVAPTEATPVNITTENSSNVASLFTSDNVNRSIVNSSTGNIVQLINHTHSWKYFASGSNLGAYCCGTGTCSQSAISTDTALERTLLASDTTYDGKAVTATLTDNATWTSLSLETPSEINYQKWEDATSTWTNIDKAPTHAGKYRAYVTLGSGDNQVTAYKEFTIGKKQLTASGTSIVAKTYDGTTVATATGTELVGVESGDAVSVQTVATFTDKNASDTDIRVDVAYTLTGSDADNYALATSTEVLSGEINRKQLTATGTSVQDKTYDGNSKATATNATLEGVVSGDVGKVSVSTLASFSDANAAEDKATTVVYSILGAEASNYIAPVTDTDLKATIYQKVVDLSWGPVEFTYDKQGHLPEATVTNLVSSDACNVTVEGTQTDAGTYTATATGLDNSNYQLSSDTDKYTHSFTINQKVATLSWGPLSFTYDGKGHLPEATVSNLESGDSCDVTVEGTQTDANAKSSTTNYTATATKLSNDNYKLSTDTDKFTKNFTINQLEAVLSWGPLSFTYDGKGHLPEATVTNLIGSDTCIVSVVGTQTNANAKSSTTDYTATATELSNKNYKLSTATDMFTKKFTIEQLTADLSWGDLELTYNGKDQKPKVTVTNLVGNDKCTVTIDGAQIDVGTYTATASDLGNKNYKLPASVTNTFTINPLTAVLAWGTDEFTYDGENHLPVASISNLQRSSDDPSVTVEGAQKNTNKYSKTDNYTATATELADDNYVLSTEPAEFTHKFTIGAKTIGLDWSNTSLIYNGKAQKPTASATGLIGSDTCIVTVTGEQTNAGSYTATAAGLLNDNYQLPKVVTKAFTIAKKLITVSAGSYKVSKVYDSTTGPGEPSGDISVSGILSQDSNVYVKKGIIPRYQSQDVGTYSLTLPVTLEGDKDNNYKLDVRSIQVPGTITQKTIHVSADDQTSYVEEELNNLTYTSDELLGSDTFSGRLETNADKYNPGTYSIKQGSLTAGNNYKIEFQDGTYTVEDDEAEASLVASAHAYKKSIRLTWTEPNEQATYRVYIANCNKNNWKLVKTTTASAYTKKSLKVKKSYKMYVAAYDEDGKLIAKTPVVHCMTTGGKYSNATSVKATENMTLTAGEVSYVDAKITKKSSKKTLLWKKHCAKIRYYSADNDVATVDADGNVTAVGHGIVNIYSVAPSGAYVVTTVKVIK